MSTTRRLRVTVALETADGSLDGSTVCVDFDEMDADLLLQHEQQVRNGTHQFGGKPLADTLLDVLRATVMLGRAAAAGAPADPMMESRLAWTRAAARRVASEQSGEGS